MVSSSLNLQEAELLAILQRLSRDHADDADYRELRSELPTEWPI